MSKGSEVRLSDDSRMGVRHDTPVLFCDRRLASRRQTISRNAAKWEAWPLGLSFLLMLTTLACDQSPKSAEAEPAAPAPVEAPAPAPAPTPVAAPAPSVPEPEPEPEPAPEPAEPTDEALPEIPLPDGILAQWSSVDEQPRVLIANSFIRAFEAVSPPDHHSSKRERIFRAIILDRCMIKLAEKPASMDMKLNVAASVCYVTSGLDKAKK
jgi:hypothetical protein